MPPPSSGFLTLLSKSPLLDMQTKILEIRRFGPFRQLFQLQIVQETCKEQAIAAVQTNRAGFHLGRCRSRQNQKNLSRQNAPKMAISATTPMGIIWGPGGRPHYPFVDWALMWRSLHLFVGRFIYISSKCWPAWENIPRTKAPVLIRVGSDGADPNLR